MNRFKQAIAGHQPQIGMWQALASPYSAEICAGAGFDWLLLDGEHAPNDLPLILSQLQAVAPYDVEPVVRLPVGDSVLIKQYLDIGARTILVPMVDSGAFAEELVRSTRYPPNGSRGVGTAIGRASRWNRRQDYIHNAEDEICLLVQVESMKAVENIDDIAGIDGVDGVFVGPSDLAASLGHLGDPTHPEVQSVIESTVRSIRKAGKPVGILMADRTLAQKYLKMGVSFVAVGTDVSVLARATESLAAAFGSNRQSKTSPESSVY